VAVADLLLRDLHKVVDQMAVVMVQTRQQVATEQQILVVAVVLIQILLLNASQVTVVLV
jgi:hypothetical protein